MKLPGGTEAEAVQLHLCESPISGENIYLVFDEKTLKFYLKCVDANGSAALRAIERNPSTIRAYLNQINQVELVEEESGKRVS